MANPETIHPLTLDGASEYCNVFVRKDVRFSRNGMAEVTLQIPWQHRDFAMKLLDWTGTPLELHIKPCRKTLRSL